MVWRQWPWPLRTYLLLHQLIVIPSLRGVGVLGMSYRTLLSTPIQLRGLSEIADRYDCILLDQFGVLHDGRNPLPHAVETVTSLQKQGKQLIVLSNSSQRSSTALRRIKRMGFANLEQILTSGEATWHYLAEHFKGKSCCFVTWNSFQKDNYLSELDISLASIEKADFLFLHGSQTIVTSDDGKDSSRSDLQFIQDGRMDEHLLHILHVAIERDIPVVCANLDLTAKLADGSTGYMPGSILSCYKKLGGINCITFGKPLAPFFDSAMELSHRMTISSSVSLQDKRVESPFDRKRRTLRTLHIGDSLHHDIQGID